MDLRRYLRALKRGWWIVLLLALIGGVAGHYDAARAPKVYQASVTFYIGTPGQTSDTVYGANQYAQDQANSYAVLLSSQRFAQRVLGATDLDLTSQELAGKITGSADTDTTFVTAQIRDTSLRELRAIQRGVAAQFPGLVNDITTNNSVTLSVTSQPPVSSVPVEPRPTIETIVGAALGLLLGLLLAGLRELLDTSVRSGAELEELTGVPLIGSVIADNTARRTPVVLNQPTPTRRAEDFRKLRTNLEFVHTAHRIQVIAVTSSVASEGKSSTAVNVAISAAERGARVLLIDADLRRPQVAEYLGFDRSVGLTTVLTGQVAFDIAVRSWGDNDLAVLPSGATPPNPSELLDSPAMHELMRRLREQYDLIVVDTPPVLAVTDAAVCSGFVDGFMMLYRYGRTRRANLVAALHFLRGVDARIVGVVMNMCPRRGVNGEQYGTYDSYVAAAPATWRGRVRRRLSALSPFGRRRRHQQVPGYTPPPVPIPIPDAERLPGAPAAPQSRPALDGPAAGVAVGFGERVSAAPPSAPTVQDAIGFASRRRRRPLIANRLRLDHLPAAAVDLAEVNADDDLNPAGDPALASESEVPVAVAREDVDVDDHADDDHADDDHPDVDHPDEGEPRADGDESWLDGLLREVSEPSRNGWHGTAANGANGTHRPVEVR